MHADIDASLEGIGGMVYHSEIDSPTQISVNSIMFLSRLIKPVEKNYWPTELEIVGICWLVSKVRHMIESAEFRKVIYIDHSAAIQIAS